MYVKFKGGDKTYECSEPVEQKVLRSGEAVGWAIMFQLQGEIDSSKFDEVVTPETISELTFTTESENPVVFTIAGYSVVTACTIRHKNTGAVTELQFTKVNEKSGV